MYFATNQDKEMETVLKIVEMYEDDDDVFFIAHIFLSG